MRFVIYTDDHEPAHVHVYYDGGEARIDINRVVAISNRGLNKRDLARSVAIVLDNRRLLLERWEKLHG